MSGSLVPLTKDREAALSLAREAVVARADPERSVADQVRYIEGRIRSGTLHGALWTAGGRPLGIAVWDPPERLGIAVRVAYLVPAAATPDAYRALLDAVDRAVGPIAFAAPVPGLSTEDEARVLRSLGFAPFHRTEMRFPTARPIPEVASPIGISIRPVRPADRDVLGRVHAAAFRGHFDRYLFLEDPDPDRDADQVIRSLCDGRWGEFLAASSFVAESGAKPVGSTLVIRSEGRALIADVAVDPAFQGRRIGEALMLRSLHALRARGEPVVALAVTEENRRAVRLYERLGFVRALGPQRQWYSTVVVPIPPGEG